MRKLSASLHLLLTATVLVACSTAKDPDTRDTPDASEGTAGASGSGGSGVRKDGGTSTGGSGGTAGGTGGTSGGSGGAGASGADAGAVDNKDSGSTTTVGTNYLPLTIGSKWTYKVTEAGKPDSTKDNEIIEKTKVPAGSSKDKEAYLVRTTKHELKNGVIVDDKTESYQALEGQRFVRYVEDSFTTKAPITRSERDLFEPSRLRLDISPARTKPGTTWTETYMQTVTTATGTVPTSKTESWTFEGFEDVVIGAKTYKNCIKITKKTNMAADTKSWWYAPGVGKVKENGGQIEILDSYTIK